MLETETFKSARKKPFEGFQENLRTASWRPRAHVGLHCAIPLLAYNTGNCRTTMKPLETFTNRCSVHR